MSSNFTFLAIILSVSSSYAASPKSRLEQLDQTILALSNAPPTVGRMGQLRALATAERYLVDREDLAQELPQAPAPPISSDRLLKLQKAVRSQLQLSFRAGESSELETEKILHDALTKALKTLGFTPSKPRKGKADVWIKTKASLDDSAGANKNLHYVVAKLEVQVVDGRTNQPVANFTESYRYGSTGYADRHKKALEHLVERVREETAPRIRRKIRGDPETYD